MRSLEADFSDSRETEREKVWTVTGKPLSITSSIKDIWKRRNLLLLLISREIRSKYKGSYLGIFWSLGRPLITLLVYFIAIGQFLGASRAIPDFAIFVYTGITIWGFFSDVVSSGTVSILGNAGIVKKIYLPRELFPLASTGAASFNFVVQLSVLLVATIVVGRPPIHIELLLAPVAILIVLVYGLALALLLSALNVFLRDIQHLVELGLVLGFWASPIVYSYTLLDSALSSNQLILAIYSANPITIAVLDMQKALWMSGQDSGQIWPGNLLEKSIICLIIGILFLLITQRVFTRLQKSFAQEM